MADKDFVVKNGLIVGDTATISGVVIDPSGATSGQVLKFDGSKFAPASDEGATDASAYATTIGDGTNSTYTVTHNLNTKNIFVIIRDADSPYDSIQARWEATTDNSITLDFSTAISSNSRRVIVIAAGNLDYYSSTIGDGTSSTINIDHNLGSRDVAVTLRNASSLYENINAAIFCSTAKTISVDFGLAPTANSIVASVFFPLEDYTYSSVIGDGTNTSYIITHNLNTRDIGIIIRNTESPYDLIQTRWEATSLNTATIYFSGPPSSSSRKVTIFSALGGSRYVPSLGEIAVKVPETSSSSGSVGDIAYDSNYVYICVATNTWKRSSLNTW